MKEEALTEDEIMELTVIKQVFLDEAPYEGWEKDVDQGKLAEYRNDIRKWDRKELLRFCKNHYAWEDNNVTYTKALIDAIEEMTHSPIKEA